MSPMMLGPPIKVEPIVAPAINIDDPVLVIDAKGGVEEMEDTPEQDDIDAGTVDPNPTRKILVPETYKQVEAEPEVIEALAPSSSTDYTIPALIVGGSVVVVMLMMMTLR